MKTRTLITLTLAAALLPCGAAGAKLPDFTGDLITAKSMGGAKLGMTYGQVVGKWGGGGVDEAVGERCGGPNSDPLEWTCSWKKTSTLKAWVRFENGQARAIGISGPRRSRPGRLRTRDGLGLGTSTEKLFKSGCGSSPSTTGVVYRCNGVSFYGNRSGRVASVTIG